jgi:hypothetical protein
MKTVQWVLIGCRVLAISVGVTLLASGCGDSGAGFSGGTQSEEEVKWDSETRKAMEAASKVTKKR